MKLLKRKLPLIIYPNNINKIRWDIFMSIVLIISVITTPIDLAFPYYSENIDGYSNFLYVIDILFLIDIFITFFTAYENELLEIED